MRITGAHATPNPDAIKLDLDEPQTAGIRSYRNAASTAGQAADQPDQQADPLAHALLAIEGVTGVLIHERFITLSREPGKSWAGIRKAADRALQAHSVDNDAAG